jgi:hypothetical protein
MSGGGETIVDGSDRFAGRGRPGDTMDLSIDG